MIDALLFSWRDGIRNAAMGYDARSCEIMIDGAPPPKAGDFFLSVHSGDSSSEMDNALDEYLTVLLTLTMRVTVPLDRLGDSALASKLARRRGPQGQPSFNARCDWLRAFGHMNWGLLQDANQFLVEASPEATQVYGFVEPGRYRGREDPPPLMTGEWFGAESEALDVGIKSELKFERFRRLQGMALYV